MKIHKTLGTGLSLLVLILLIGLLPYLMFASQPWQCPCCKKLFPTDPRYPGYFENFKRLHMQRCCIKTSSGDSSTSDPLFQLTLQMGSLLGQELHKLIFGNPEEEARQRQLMQAEALRFMQLEEARRAEEERAKQELYERLSQTLKLSGLGQLAPKGFDGGGSGLTPKDLNSSSALEMKLGDNTSKKDDDLRPKGSSFFGLGGDADASAPLEDINDPMVVDLRNYRRAAFLAEAAALGNPEDAPLLLDEAVKAAQGDKSFVGNVPASVVIVVNEAGLRDFQVKNIAYTKAHDLQMRQTERFNLAQLRRELAAQAVRTKRAELEKELAQKLDKAQLEEIHRLMAEIFAAAKVEYEAWLKAKAEMDVVRSREAFERAALLASVRIASIPSPRVPAEIIRSEREALEPSFLDRSRHEALKPLGHKWSDEFDKFISENYLDFKNPTAEARVKHLVKRIQDLSSYPDDPIRVKIIGQARDPNVEQGFEKGAWASSDTIYIGSSYLNRQPAPSDDELLFVIGHEMTHIQRDHFIVMKGSIEYEKSRDWVQALLGTEESKWLPEIKDVVRDVRLRDLNYAQELESMRLGVALGLGAGAKMEGIGEYFRQFPRYNGRSRLEESASDYPTPSQHFDALKKIYGEVLCDPWIGETSVDSSVVDLRFLDLDKPITVDLNIVKGRTRTIPVQPDPETFKNVSYNEGFADLLRFDPDSAVRHFEQAQKERPNDPIVHNGLLLAQDLVKVHQQKEQDAKAEAAHWTMQTYVALMSDEAGGALAFITRARDLNPDDKGIRVLAALTEKVARESNLANTPEKRAAYRLVGNGIVSVAKGDHAMAVNYLEVARRLSPDDLYIADLLRQARNLETGRADANKH